jgi:hypothetical protein
MRKCTACIYSFLQDEGYSNWTVEGMSIDCLLRLNNDFPIDVFYAEEPALLFADECFRFKEGDSGIHLDVDGEDGIYFANAEIARLYGEYLVD